MERHTFSIEPYIDQGGILGAELEVNEKAASSVMRRTALRRDVLVAREYGQRFNNVVGLSELAIVPSRPVFKLVGETSVSNLSKTPRQWIIGISDNRLHDEVDTWLSKNFKRGDQISGSDIYRRQYFRRLRESLGEAIFEAFWNEKIDVFSSSVKFSSEKYFLGLSTLSGAVVGGYLAYDGAMSQIELLGENNPMTIVYFVETVSGGLVFLITGLTVGNRIRSKFVESKRNVEPEILKSYEHFIPNLQILSLFAGNTSLTLNANKLIRLKS